MTNIHHRAQRIIEALAMLPVGPEGPTAAPEMIFNIAGGYEVSIWYSYNDGGWKASVVTPAVSAKTLADKPPATRNMTQDEAALLTHHLVAYLGHEMTQRTLQIIGEFGADIVKLNQAKQADTEEGN